MFLTLHNFHHDPYVIYVLRQRSGRAPPAWGARVVCWQQTCVVGGPRGDSTAEWQRGQLASSNDKLTLVVVNTTFTRFCHRINKRREALADPRCSVSSIWGLRCPLTLSPFSAGTSTWILPDPCMPKVNNFLLFCFFPSHVWYFLGFKCVWNLPPVCLVLFGLSVRVCVCVCVYVLAFIPVQCQSSIKYLLSHACW